MAALYAGILGCIAFVHVVVRSLLWGGGADGTLLRATLSLAVFGGIGYVAGRIAQQLTEDSVRSRFASLLAAHDEASGNQAVKTK